MKELNIRYPQAVIVVCDETMSVAYMESATSSIELLHVDRFFTSTSTMHAIAALVNAIGDRIHKLIAISVCRSHTPQRTECGDGEPRKDEPSMHAAIERHEMSYAAVRFVAEHLGLELRELDLDDGQDAIDDQHADEDRKGLDTFDEYSAAEMAWILANRAQDFSRRNKTFGEVVIFKERRVWRTPNPGVGLLEFAREIGRHGAHAVVDVNPLKAKQHQETLTLYGAIWEVRNAVSSAISA
jgi:hypothetical protein